MDTVLAWALRPPPASSTTAPRSRRSGSAPPASAVTTRSRPSTSALENGYRLVDTAVNYGNEVEVGEAIRRSGVPRDEIVVTSKIPGRHHAYDDAITSTRESLERLGLDRIDVHLIHWPNPAQEKYHETWRALVQLRDDGLVRSPGVSNFTREHLEQGHRRHRGDAGAQPDRAAPLLPAGGDARRRRRAGRAHRVVEPDGQAAGAVRRAGGQGGRRGSRRDAGPGGPALAAPARQPADPEVRTPSRQRENLDLDGFELTDDEVAAITALARPDGRLFGGDPDTPRGVLTAAARRRRRTSASTSTGSAATYAAPRSGPRRTGWRCVRT